MYALPVRKSVAMYAIEMSELDALPALTTLDATGKVSLTPSVRIACCRGRYRIIDTHTANGDMLPPFLPQAVAQALPCSQPGYVRFDGAGEPHDAAAAMTRAWATLTRQFPRLVQQVTHGQAVAAGEDTPHGYGLMANL